MMTLPDATIAAIMGETFAAARLPHGGLTTRRSTTRDAPRAGR
jgi:hypothetical protein